MLLPDLTDPRIAAIEVTPMWAGDLSIDDVDQALKDAGLPDELLPPQPSRAKCMARAFHECSPRGARIDSLPKGMGVTMSLKDVTKLDLEALSAQAGIEVREAASYHATFTAKILVQNINGTEIETLQFTPDDHPMIPLVKETYRVKRGQYKASEDLSVWFSQTIIPYVNGVGKRSRGGVYYVPASRAKLICDLAVALEALSSSSQIDREVNGVKVPIHRLTHGGKLCIEPRFADDTAAMEIMIDGVIRNTDSMLDDLSSALDPKEGKRLGKRALKTKADMCARLEAEMLQWENVCSVSLDLLRNRIEEIRAAIGVAEMAAEMEDATKSE